MIKEYKFDNKRKRDENNSADDPKMVLETEYDNRIISRLSPSIVNLTSLVISATFNSKHLSS